jgi:hypothetical protein
MANKQINQLASKTEPLVDDDYILVYDNEESTSEKTKKVAISDYVAVISTDLTLNVDTTGSDVTGTGAIDSPFASIQGALTFLNNKIIQRNVNVTIKLADGTYEHDAGLIIKNYLSVTIEGNTTTPSNVTLNFDSNLNAITVMKLSYLTCKGIKIHGSNTSGNWVGVTSSTNSVIIMTDVLIDNFNTGVLANHGAYFWLTGSGNTIDSCAYGIKVVWDGFVGANGATISNNTSYGAYASVMGKIMVNSCTLSGNNTNTGTGSGGIVTIA